MTNDLSQFVERLRASGFRELAGTRIAARIPVAESLLNDLVARFRPESGAIRQLTLHPQPNGPDRRTPGPTDGTIPPSHVAPSDRAIPPYYWAS